MNADGHCGRLRGAVVMVLLPCILSDEVIVVAVMEGCTEERSVLVSVSGVGGRVGGCNSSGSFRCMWKTPSV
jgi:hypothetical protein